MDVIHYFCYTFMKRGKGPHNLIDKISAILMMLALIWLTASLPYVYEAQQAAKKTVSQTTNSGNPLSGTTEEKTSSVNSLSEEYLHHIEDQVDFTVIKKSHVQPHFEDVYIAFHGELISPPPEA